MVCETGPLPYIHVFLGDKLMKQRLLSIRTFLVDNSWYVATNLLIYIKSTFSGMTNGRLIYLQKGSKKAHIYIERHILYSGESEVSLNCRHRNIIA